LIPTIHAHGAHSIECECEACGFIITDAARAVIVNRTLAITCPSCDHHMTIELPPNVWNPPTR
jgi:hypothetical protein